ncbi:MAG: SRPBCC family protein [Nitriliruptoraceae bacterium]
MATVRHHTTIDRSPDEVWKVVADAGAISTWFPIIETSELDGKVRHCTVQGGGQLEEEIVTSDDELRRFQYRIVGGDMPLDFHLATIDVLPVGEGSLVVYSTEVEPAEAAGQMGAVLSAGLDGLRHHLEG